MKLLYNDYSLRNYSDVLRELSIEHAHIDTHLESIIKSTNDGNDI